MLTPDSQSVVISSPAQLARVGHWAGSLNLTMVKLKDKTVLKSKQQTGPYTVQRALYPEVRPNNGICHLILLHPPGGLVEGDKLSLNVHCMNNTHSFITTPSAGKVYQCDTSDAGQVQNFTIETGAILEWFPQEMILYDKSLSTLKTQVNLLGDAQFIGWEISCLGREIAGDYFQQGQLTQSIELYRDTKPLVLERINIDASNTDLRTQKWGLAGHSIFGTFIMTGASLKHIEQARDIIGKANEQDCPVGITLIDNVLICRGLSSQSRHLKKIFTQIWRELRHEVVGVMPHQPRIWNT